MPISLADEHVSVVYCAGVVSVLVVHWMLLPAAAQAAQLSVALADVTAMMERVGRSSSDAVAEQILQLLILDATLSQLRQLAEQV